MRVKKRDNTFQEVSFDKVITRLQNLCDMKPILRQIDITEIAQKVCSRIYDEVTTVELDELAAEQCTHKSVEHIEYSHLASRIIISNNQKITSPSFSETIYILYNNLDINGVHSPLVSKEVYEFVLKNKNKLNDYIDYSRDFNFDYFGFKTMEKAYLIKKNGKIIERIQHLILRVSIGIHLDNLKDALETYDMISSKHFTHATPTLFHSGTCNPQLLSCFLLGMDDSISGMYKTLADCAQISKWAGGIGIHIHDIRGNNSKIRGTNGTSSGIIPMLKVYNEVARHVNQSGKRNGSFAIYLEPHHPDIMQFLEAKKNHGDENSRARDLFYAVWLSDLFMTRVKNNELWSLICPDKCKGLSNVYGDDFEQLYLRYESNPDNVIKKIPAVQIWKEILISQMETGTPYICYKDAANIKSNQKNIGTIKSSNLCTEIMEYSDDKEYACCTLSSICLPSFIVPFNISSIRNVKVYSKTGCKFCSYAKKYLNSFNIAYDEISLDDTGKRDEFFIDLRKTHDIQSNTVPQIFINDSHIGGFNELYTFMRPTFDYNKLYDVTKVVTNNLNKIIDINYYPVQETKLSNLKHRPLGIGVQGLADVYARFKFPFDSDEAKELNKNIFATIYYASCYKSMELSKERGVYINDLKNRLSDIDLIPELYDDKLVLNNLKTNDLYHKYKPLRSELDRSTHFGAYSSFIGSPLSNGKFQFDLWGVKPIDKVNNFMLNWKHLQDEIQLHGIRNSLLLAPMPTASTSQIMGNTECIEPYTSNIYSRGTLAGQFIIINKYLQDDLLKIGLWNNKLKDDIILKNGSVSKISDIPDIIKNIYKISWDLSMKTVIDQAADRGAYICQSQSLNLWSENPNFNSLSSMHMYSWKKGLKTGMYYLRRRATVKAQSFSIDIKDEEECLMCSS